MITKCPKCNISLVMGKAIKPKFDDPRCLGVDEKLSWKKLKIIDCLKCPECGFSDDGE